MTITANATYKQGVLTLDEPVSLTDNARVTVQITAAIPAARSEEHEKTAEELKRLLPADDPLRDVIGIGHGPGDLAENHDHYIYGLPKKGTPRK